MRDYLHLRFTRLVRTISLKYDTCSHLIVQYTLVLFCLVCGYASAIVNILETMLYVMEY